MPDTGDANLAIAVELDLAAFIAQVREGQTQLTGLGDSARSAQSAVDALSAAAKANADADVAMWRAVAQNENAQTAITNLQTRVAALSDQLKTLGSEHPELRVNDNFADATARLEGMRTQLAALADQPYTAELGAQMATLRGEIATVQGELAGLKTEAAATGGVFADLNGVISGFGAMAMLSGVLALVDGLKQAIDQSIAWQTTLNQLQGNTTLTDAQMQQLAASIHGMAASTSADLNQLADGYMHVTNLGFSVADSQQIADAAFKSSASTGAQLGSTMNAVASVMKEYNQAGGEAARTTDLLHNAAAQGNMTMEQFVEAGGRTIATAANLGDSLQDVTAAYAALTRHGMDAATAGTQLTGILTHIVNPTAAARMEIEHLSQVTGVDLVGDFSQAGLQAKGLYGIFQDVQTATAGDSAEILKLIPALRGGQGALALTGSGAQDFTNILKSQNDVLAGKSTPTQDAFARTTHTTGYELGQAANQARLFGLALGDNLVRSVQAATGASDDFVGKLGAQGAAMRAITDLMGQSSQAADGLSESTKAAARSFDGLTAGADSSAKGIFSVSAEAEHGASLIDNWGEGAISAAQAAGQLSEGLTRVHDSLLPLDDLAAASTQKIGAALKQMATDSAAGSADASKALNDFATLLHNLPNDLTPAEQALVSNMTQTWETIKEQGGISAQGFHDIVISWIQKLRVDGDFETANAMQAILDEMAAATPKAATSGKATGESYIVSLVNGHLAHMPELQQLIDATLQTMSISQITKMLGGDAGRAYAAEMAAEMAAGMQKIADALSHLLPLGLSNSLGKPFADMAAQARAAALSTATDLGLIGDHYGKTTTQIEAELKAQQAAAEAALKREAASARAEAAHQRALAAQQAALARHQAAVEAHAQAVATAEAKSADEVIKDLGKAELATVDGTKTIAQAYTDLLPILTAKLPAGMEWLQNDYSALLAQMTSDTPPSLAQIEQEFQAWNARLLASNNGAWRLLAQANVDALSEAEKKLADAQVKAAQEAAQKLAEAQKQAGDFMSQAVAAEANAVAKAKKDEEQAVTDATRIFQEQIAAQVKAEQELQKAFETAALAAVDAAHKQAVAQQQATQQAEDAMAAAVQAANQAAESLAKDLGSVGTAILSGKDSPLQALIALGPLADAAVKAGLGPVAAEIQALLARAAAGGAVSLAEIFQVVQQAEQELAQSGDALAAAEARQAEAELQQAAAVQQAQAALNGLQTAQKAAQAAVTAASDAVKEQQAAVQALQKQYQDAQTALNNFKSAQLQGEQQLGDQGFAVGQQQKLADLAQKDLAQTHDPAQAAALIQQQYAAILAERQKAEAALQQQIATTTNADQKKALQAQLDQLKGLDTSQGSELQSILGALGGADPSKALDAIIAQLQDQAGQIGDIAGLTFDPLKKAIQGVADTTKELDFGTIIQGIDGSKDAMSKLGPQIDAANKQLAILQKQEAIAQQSLQDATAAVQAQQAQLQLLQQGAQTTATAVGTSLGGMLTDLAAAFKAQTIPGTTGTIAAAWFGPKGLMPELYNRVDGTSYALRPNVRLAMSGMVSDISDAIDGGMPDIVHSWQGDMSSMAQASQAAALAIEKAAADAIDAWKKMQSIVGGKGDNPTQSQAGSNAAFSAYASGPPQVHVTAILRDDLGRSRTIQTLSVESSYRERVRTQGDST